MFMFVSYTYALFVYYLTSIPIGVMVIKGIVVPCCSWSKVLLLQSGEQFLATGKALLLSLQYLALGSMEVCTLYLHFITDSILELQKYVAYLGFIKQY